MYICGVFVSFLKSYIFSSTTTIFCRGSSTSFRSFCHRYYGTFENFSRELIKPLAEKKVKQILGSRNDYNIYIFTIVFFFLFLVSLRVDIFVRLTIIFTPHHFLLFIFCFVFFFIYLFIYSLIISIIIIISICLFSFYSKYFLN